MEPTGEPTTTMAPTPQPTLEPVFVDSEEGLAAALADYVTIELQKNITVSAGGSTNAFGSTSSAFNISDLTSLTINGNGFAILFSSSDAFNGRIFEISRSEVEMNNLTIENGYYMFFWEMEGIALVDPRSTAQGLL